MKLPGDLAFLYPGLLLALLALPVLAWWLGRRRPVPSITVPTLLGLGNLPSAPRRGQGAVKLAASLLPLALILIALARPRIPRGETPDPSKGIDIILTLDFSRSMAEEDFRLDRRRVSRHKALETVTSKFVAGRPNDRIGIVCFARTPFLVSPLTLDHNYALTALRETELATGTGIGWALLASANFLKKDSDRSRVIILITDGENSAGPRPNDPGVVNAVVRGKIKVYTVLIGPETVPPSAAANHDLNKTARATGGQFFQARDSNALEAIYRQIDVLEKRELVQKRYVQWRELYPWLVVPALVIFVGQVAWGIGRRRVP